MSDTVLVALITFASGFLGVLVGAVANYHASKLGVQADRGKLLHEEKKTAYRDVASAYLAAIDFIASHDEPSREIEDEAIEIARQFFRAQATAILIAPSPVQESLFLAARSIQEMTSTWHTPDSPEIFAALTGTMREDLLSFSHGAEKGQGRRRKR